MELEADHLGGQHVKGLAQDGRLGLDASHAPADDSEAVDHGGVGIGANQAIWEGYRASIVRAQGDDGGKVFQIDLMDDACRWRYHTELMEGVLPPVEELVALTVALELVLGVELQGLHEAVAVYLHGVVDYQVHGHLWLDEGRISSQPLHRGAHGGQVHQAGDPCEVL